MQSAVSTAPTPQAVDAMVREYNEQKLVVDAASEQLRIRKSTLIDAIQRHGYVPAGADKSLRLDGIEFVSTVTTASTVEIVDSSVVRLQLALSAAKKSRLFRLLFDRRVKYSLVKDAADKLKTATAGMPDAAQKKFALLFASCFDVGTKAPALNIDSIADLRAKEERAAKKAAKKGGRK